MTRLFVPGLVALAVMSAGVWTTYTTCPGCVDRTRANSACEWTGDTTFAVDPTNVAHRRHLVADAHLAEELAVRHADGEFGRRFGVEHHGGLLDGGRFRRACLDRMLHAVGQNHQVTPEQVANARAQRDLRFDVAVTLLFVPFYVLAAIGACRWVFRRFSPEERAARRVGLTALSLAVSLLGIQLLRLWAGVWETIRVGNGHIGTGIRSAAAARWASEVFDEQLIVAIVLFWLIAFSCHRIASAGPSATPIGRGDGRSLRA
jgi:hypothetical protein